MAQRKRAGPITQRSMDRNHPLLLSRCNRIVVSTSRCGRDNPGSNPGYSKLFQPSFFKSRKSVLTSHPHWHHKLFPCRPATVFAGAVWRRKRDKFRSATPRRYSQPATAPLRSPPPPVSLKFQVTGAHYFAYRRDHPGKSFLIRFLYNFSEYYGRILCKKQIAELSTNEKRSIFTIF